MKKTKKSYLAIFNLFLFLFSFTASIAAAQTAYITNDDGTVSVIDTAKDTVTATVTVGNDPYGVTVTQDETKVYVTDYKDNRVYGIDTATNKVTTNVPVGSSPEGIAVNSDWTNVYVANYGSNSVSVIDTTTKQVTSVSGFNCPFGVAIV